MGSSEKRDRAADKVSVRPLSTPEKPVRRNFPGPRGAEAALRVAIDRAPYAELIAHAKSSLEAEVCGVLVGQIGEDDEGRFAHVEAIVRGNAATQAATHVTFTQATWDAIHQALERDHPRQRIVGWYHTHPGFGVEFSEMDLFIQRNFFSGPTQIALVMDPLSGAVAIAINSETDVAYLRRFWVDGREQIARTPAASIGSPGPGAPAGAEANADLTGTVKGLESRVSQLIQAVDEQRTLFYRMVTTVGIALCLGIIGVVGYLIYNQYYSRYEPPRLNGYVPVPIQVGNKTVLVGVGVVQWDVPPEVNATLIQLAKMKQATDASLPPSEIKEGASVSPAPPTATDHPTPPAGSKLTP